MEKAISLLGKGKRTACVALFYIDVGQVAQGFRRYFLVMLVLFFRYFALLYTLSISTPVLSGV